MRGVEFFLAVVVVGLFALGPVSWAGIIYWIWNDYWPDPETWMRITITWWSIVVIVLLAAIIVDQRR